MLHAESMCSIHRKLDHSYLPRTCADFPRYCHSVTHKTEVLGTLSCPELAHKCLLDTQAFDLVNIETPFTPNQQPPYRASFNFAAKLYANPIQRNFELIREVIFQTLKPKDFALWQKLLVIDLLINKLSPLNDQRHSRISAG